jgi:hypothetical protein
MYVNTYIHVYTHKYIYINICGYLNIYIYIYIYIIQIGDQARILGYINITYFNLHFVFLYIHIQRYI